MKVSSRAVLLTLLACAKSGGGGFPELDRFAEVLKKDAADANAKACLAGTAKACAAAADAASKRGDEDTLTAAYAMGCKAGDWDACVEVAARFAEGNTVTKDVAYASKLYGRGCDAGNGMSCSSLGDLVKGEDAAKAAALWEKACSLKYDYGCQQLEHLYYAKKDSQRVLEYQLKTCDANPRHCGTAGSTLMYGIGVPEDRARALPLFRRGCLDGHDADSCTEACSLGDKECCAKK